MTQNYSSRHLCKSTAVTILDTFSGKLPFFFAWRNCPLQPSNAGTMLRGRMCGVDSELDPEGILDDPHIVSNCHLGWSAKLLAQLMGHLIGRYPVPYKRYE